MPPTSCKELLKEYCLNCTFGGLRYIADDTKHWAERWLWLGLVVLCWYGSGLLIVAAWDSFTLSPISFGVETTYTDWDTKMPAVAVCEAENNNKLYNVSDTIWTTTHLMDLEEILKEITYYRGASKSLINVCFSKNKKPDPNCPMSNYSYYASLVRSDCPDLLKDCSYNGKSFNCCEHFLPIDTDIGRCFIINSIQIRNPNPYPMIGNMKNKRNILRFKSMIISMLYTLGEDEVPTITTLQASRFRMKLGYNYKRQLAIKNIENAPLVQVETRPEQRACYFHFENADGVYPLYSYSACTVLCRKRAQLNICNCTDHFMLGVTEEQRCDISGMSCLHEHSYHLTLLKPPWAPRPGLSCNCLPSCNDTEIIVVKDSQISNRKDKKVTSVEVELAYLPTERYKRSLVRSRLDLVVSVGGTTGLFLGASLLSFVEFIFYFTIRYASNILIEDRKTMTNSQRNRAIKIARHVAPKKEIKFQDL